MTPIVDRLQVEFDDRVSVFQLNAVLEANARLQNQWGLRGHPTFAVVASQANFIILPIVTFLLIQVFSLDEPLVVGRGCPNRGKL
jgi:hypothetical protein